MEGKTDTISRVLLKDRLKIGDLIVKILGLIVAGIWTWYVFHYEHDILPSLTPVHAIVSYNVQYIKSDDSLDYYSINFKIKNESNEIDKFPFSYYSISVYKLKKTHNYDLNIDTDWKNGEPYTKYIQIDTNVNQNEYIAFSKLFIDNCRILPHSEISGNNIFAVPKNKFDGIRTEVYTYQNRDLDLTPKWKVDDKDKTYNYPDLMDAKGNIVWQFRHPTKLENSFFIKEFHYYMTGNNAMVNLHKMDENN
jgi:hypothetical protein